MAKQMPKKSEDSGGDWLNTYADMVTLLLTFFVLLFACSNLDESKVQYIFQAFQMRGKFINSAVTEQNPNPSDSTIGNTDNEPDYAGGEGDMPQSFDELYQYLSDYVEQNNLGQSVAIENGESHITLKFDNTVMFDGNSYLLRDEGRKILAQFVPAIHAVNDSIQKLIVYGHTAKAVSPVNDYYLSANRAVSVQNFLEFRGTVDASKYSVVGEGPNRPAESNDTAEGRAKNRRVEITLLKANNMLDFSDKSVLKDILESLGVITDELDPFKEDTPPNLLPDGAAEKITNTIKNLYENFTPSSGVGFGPGSADGSEFIVEETEASS